MTVPTILIVDDQRDIIRLLRSAIDSINQNIRVVEAQSGEEALLEITRSKIDLLIVDYRLPGMTGVELMKKLRTKDPEAKVFLITGVTDPKVRRDLAKAGANAIFEKPVPMADFLDSVERSLGLVRTIFPAETFFNEDAQRENLSGLLVNFRKKQEALAVFLLSDRGRIFVRAGDLPDSGMEVSLMSSIMAIHSAGQKISRFVHQDPSSSYHVFEGGDHDMILIPVDTSHALLVVGHDLVKLDHFQSFMQTLLSVRGEVQRLLEALGFSGSKAPSERIEPVIIEEEPEIDMEIDNLFKTAQRTKVQTSELEAFWDGAMKGHDQVATNPEVLTYDQARQLGLTPKEDK